MQKKSEVYMVPDSCKCYGEMNRGLGWTFSGREALPKKMARKGYDETEA